MQDGSGDEALEGGGEEEGGQERAQEHDGQDADVAAQPLAQLLHVRLQGDGAQELALLVEDVAEGEERLPLEVAAPGPDVGDGEAAAHVGAQVAGEGLALGVEHEGRHHVAARAQAAQQLLRSPGVLEVDGGAHVDGDALRHQAEVGGHALAGRVDVVGHEGRAGHEQGEAAREHHDEGQLALDGRVLQEGGDAHRAPTSAPARWRCAGGWRRSRSLARAPRRG